jgi:hypothetical protein
MPCFTRLSSLSLVQTGFICAMIAVSLATVSSVTAWGAPSAVAESCSSVVTTATQAKAEAAEQSGDDATARQQYLAAANCGLAKAQRQLGLMLLTGRGGAKNETEAADWLGQAAAQGDALGQLALATLLRNGLGVAKNEVSAHQWYLAAAKQGLPMAQYYVGTQFSSGRGTTMDGFIELPSAVMPWRKWRSLISKCRYSIQTEVDGNISSAPIHGPDLPADIRAPRHSSRRSTPQRWSRTEKPFARPLT